LEAVRACGSVNRSACRWALLLAKGPVLCLGSESVLLLGERKAAAAEHAWGAGWESALGEGRAAEKAKRTGEKSAGVVVKLAMGKGESTAKEKGVWWVRATVQTTELETGRASVQSSENWSGQRTVEESALESAPKKAVVWAGSRAAGSANRSGVVTAVGLVDESAAVWAL